MFDLDKQSIDFQCPHCEFWNSALLGQVRLRDVVICRGCKANIRLDDHMNEYRKAARALAQALGNVESLLSRFR